MPPVSRERKRTRMVFRLPFLSRTEYPASKFTQFPASLSLLLSMSAKLSITTTATAATAVALTTAAAAAGDVTPSLFVPGIRKGGRESDPLQPLSRLPSILSSSPFHSLLHSLAQSRRRRRRRRGRKGGKTTRKQRRDAKRQGSKGLKPASSVRLSLYHFSTFSLSWRLGSPSLMPLSPSRSFLLLTGSLCCFPSSSFGESEHINESTGKKGNTIDV